jgi:Ca2+-dependent lipid-binding protein
VQGDCHLQGRLKWIDTHRMNNVDPYFSFELGKQKIKSQIIHKSLSPYFGNEELMICIDANNHNLTIHCWNDSAAKNDKLLCSAVYSMSDIYYTPNVPHKVCIPLSRKISNSFKLFNKKTQQETKMDLIFEYQPFNH